MGQCCIQQPADAVDSNGDDKKSKKLSLTRTKREQQEPKHHRIPDTQSSGSQSPKEDGVRATFEDKKESNAKLSILNDEDEFEEDEEIDLSQFQEDVAEFIEFWHHHFQTLTKESIHNALVRRVHNKVKGEYNLPLSIQHYNAQFRIAFQLLCYKRFSSTFLILICQCFCHRYLPLI